MVARGDGVGGWSLLQLSRLLQAEAGHPLLTTLSFRDTANGHSASKASNDCLTLQTDHSIDPGYTGSTKGGSRQGQKNAVDPLGTKRAPIATKRRRFWCLHTTDQYVGAATV